MYLNVIRFIPKPLLWITAICLFSLSASLQANSCSLKDFSIALDIGHSPTHPGATSARGVPEYQFNKNLVALLQQQLKQQGFENVHVLSEHDVEMPLWSRSALANTLAVDILLSIHHDSLQTQYLESWEYQNEEHAYSDKFSGHSLFVSNKNEAFEDSLKLANLLGKELRQEGFIPTLHHAENILGENRLLLDEEKGIYQYDDLIILKKSRTPAVLLESGVILNRDDEILLSNLIYQKALTKTVAAGIQAYAAEWLITCEFEESS